MVKLHQFRNFIALPLNSVEYESERRYFLASAQKQDIFKEKSMIKNNLLNHFLICSLTLLPIPFDLEFGFIVAICALDILIFLYYAFVYILIKKSNCLAPTFWAILGYILFGQFPVVLNYILDLYDPIQYSIQALITMGMLILVGYRALIAGILVILPKTMDVKYCSLPEISLFYPLVLISIGTLTRIIVRNNVGTSIIEYAWYHSFLLLSTPVGVALLCSVAGEKMKSGFIPPIQKTIIFFLLFIAALNAMVDVSRKDAGMILLYIIIFVFFKIIPQYPVLYLNIVKQIKLSILMLLLGFILMGIRSYSWSRELNTSLSSEIKVSFNERRANDMTNMLAFVLETTPSKYPFLYGWTLGSLLPIPRAIYSGRAPAHCYIVGLQYRGIDLIEFDQTLYNANPLSISAHMLGEGYANFGIPGALSFEFIFGILVAVYEKRLNQGRLIVLRMIFPIILYFILTQQRGDLAMMNTAWIMLACITCFVLLVCSKSYRKNFFRVANTNHKTELSGDN